MISIVTSGQHLCWLKTGRRFIQTAEAIVNQSRCTGLGPTQIVELEREHEQLGEKEEMKE